MNRQAASPHPAEEWHRARVARLHVPPGDDDWAENRTLGSLSGDRYPWWREHRPRRRLRPNVVDMVGARQVSRSRCLDQIMIQTDRLAAMLTPTRVFAAGVLTPAMSSRIGLDHACKLGFLSDPGGTPPIRQDDLAGASLLCVYPPASLVNGLFRRGMAHGPPSVGA